MYEGRKGGRGRQGREEKSCVLLEARHESWQSSCHFPPYGCVCMYVCVWWCAMCICVVRGQHLMSSSSAFHPSFWDMGCHWPQNSWVQLGRLPNEFQGFNLPPPQAAVIDMCFCAWFSCGCWGSELSHGAYRISTLLSKPSPKPSIISFERGSLSKPGAHFVS